MRFDYKWNTEQFSLPLSILLPLFMAFFFFRWGGNPEWWIGGLFFSYFTAVRIIDLVLAIMWAPSAVRLEEGQLIANMLYGRGIRCPIKEITSISDISFLQLLIDHTIVVRIGQDKTLFFRRNLKNLKDFVVQIRNENPGCGISGRYLEKLLASEI